MSSAKQFFVVLVFGVAIMLAASRPINETFTQSLKNPSANASISEHTWDICIARNPSAGIPVNQFPANVDPSHVINSRACNSAMLGEINRRHRFEGFPQVVLPRNYTRMPFPEQIMVIVNAERTSRNISPYVGMVKTLNTDALVGAQKGNDPHPSSSDGNWIAYNSIWAGGYQSALMADYDWMYNDGWGGTLSNTINIDCTSFKSVGCWGHREDILTAYSPSDGMILVAGAALVTQGPPFLALPSWAAAFEQVPSNDVRIYLELGSGA